MFGKGSKYPKTFHQIKWIKQIQKVSAILNVMNIWGFLSKMTHTILSLNGFNTVSIPIVPQQAMEKKVEVEEKIISYQYSGWMIGLWTGNNVALVAADVKIKRQIPISKEVYT